MIMVGAGHALRFKQLCGYSIGGFGAGMSGTGQYQATGCKMVILFLMIMGKLGHLKI